MTWDPHRFRIEVGEVLMVNQPVIDPYTRAEV